MRVAILHNAVSPEENEADQDVLEQVSAVSAALRALGHESTSVASTLDLATLRGQLLEHRPDVVFNLVEALGGSDWLIHVVPGLLDVLRLPYTGSPTEAIFLSTQKLLAKGRLHQAGLPTPAWAAAGWLGLNGDRLPHAGPWIVKTVCEHASFAIDDDSILHEAPADWNVWLAARQHQLGRPCFAEQFVDGREFNLSILDSANGPQVLPPAEIDFGRFPADKPKIVGYRAKWIADSPEYQDTPRRFDFPASDQPLLDRLCELTRACWQLFGLRGYARVDFRVDGHGQPWILEINANPCLSPDAGFAAAVARAGLRFPEAIQRILDTAR